MNGINGNGGDDSSRTADKTEKTKKSRFEIARRILIFWCLFIGIGAVGGATGMLVAPDGSAMGMQELLPYFQVLPFADILFGNFVFPGVALLVVNGLTNLTAAALLFSGCAKGGDRAGRSVETGAKIGRRSGAEKRERAGIIAGGVFGVTLTAWICIQFVIFPANFMSTAYFIFGVAQAATGYAAWTFYRQETFAREEERRIADGAYAGIGANGKELVVCFSRMGYTRRLALERAAATGAEVYEIRSTERTAGTAGFWWCGRYAMHGWEMPIEPISVDLSRYEKVTICTPVWAFRIAATTRAFCKAAAGKIRRAEYIVVHYRKADYAGAADEMDALLGVRRERAESVCCKKGKYMKRREI